MKLYDTFIIGHISQDIIVNHTGERSELPGGAVIHSSFAAVAGGSRTGVLTKTAPEDRHILEEFNVSAEDIYYMPSRATTSIKNVYYSADKEKRRCTPLSIADPFTAADIPVINSKIFHLAGLITGDFDDELIKQLSTKGKVAVDVQGFVRVAVENELVFQDWSQKVKCLPYIHYLKTDAAEAEVLTGLTDRKEAAQALLAWGAKEVMITHNSSVITCSSEGFCEFPLKPRNLTGRTGRGDTCFSSYITERNYRDVEESLLYAAALVSLKMETPGPFKGSRADVEEYISSFY